MYKKREGPDFCSNRDQTLLCWWGWRPKLPFQPHRTADYQSAGVSGMTNRRGFGNWDIRRHEIQNQLFHGRLCLVMLQLRKGAKQNTVDSIQGAKLLQLT